jgi:hypothetical protein
MSALAIVLIAVALVLLVLLLGGYFVVRRHTEQPDYAERVRDADLALEHARAADRGWDRAILQRIAGDALTAERPGQAFEAIELILVDDRPGVADDCAHMVARSPEGHARVILTRNQGGDWAVDRIE